MRCEVWYKVSDQVWYDLYFMSMVSYFYTIFYFISTLPVEYPNYILHPYILHKTYHVWYKGIWTTSVFWHGIISYLCDFLKVLQPSCTKPVFTPLGCIEDLFNMNIRTLSLGMGYCKCLYRRVSTNLFSWSNSPTPSGMRGCQRVHNSLTSHT